MSDARSARWRWVLGIGCLLLLIAGLLLRRSREDSSQKAANAATHSGVFNTGGERKLAGFRAGGAVVS